MGATAMELIIEKQISASMARGEFDNLAGAGKPLPLRHDAQFAKVDPLVSAMTRAMGAQQLKPPSIELRNELAAVRADFAAACAAAASRGPAAKQALLAGQDAKVQHHWSELERARKLYNDACLVDRECYGAAWPLSPLPKLVFVSEVEAALQQTANA